MKKEELYGWVFTYNPYTEQYLAAKREYYHELFSGDEGNVLRSNDIKVLEALIIKTNGDKDKIEKLLK